ncbi:flagellar motor switch protein FliN [bacterium]|nr:flagellar motor switch protein FliN [bacterium]
MISDEVVNNNNQSELFELLGAWFESRRSDLELALSTLTEHKVVLEFDAPRLYSVEEVTKATSTDSVLLKARFSKEEIGGWMFLFSRKIAAMLSDLAMMGEGDVPFDESLHPGTLSEIWGQITATCETEIAALYGEEITAELPEASLDNEPALELLEIAPVVHLSIKIEGVGEGVILMIFEPSFVSLFRNKLESNESTEEINDDTNAEASDREPEIPETMSEGLDRGDFHTNSHGYNNEKSQPIARTAEFEDFSEFKTQPESDPTRKPRNIDMLLDVNLPITIELGRTSMLIRDVLDLCQGSIIELDKLSGEPVDLYVNNKKFAKGEVVVIEENFGIRITELIAVNERLKALN